MRIVFIGSVEFSLHALEHLFAINAEVVGVCALKESNFNNDHVDLVEISQTHGVPCFHTKDINSVETLSWIREKAPKVIFCFGWSNLLGQDLLALAPLGVIGFHPSALPANRGRHPLVWALVLGLEKTASTFIFIDEGADSGDILSQREIIIDDLDDARTLYDKVTQTALQQIEEFVPMLEAGTFPRQKQNPQFANTWRKRGILDGKIDWRMSAHSIHNLVRGLGAPYVGAHFMMGEQEIKVWKTALVNDVPKNIEPGKVIMNIDSSPVVMCGAGALRLMVIEPSIEITSGSYL